MKKPAPEWKAQAVVNGEFKKVALSDYRGTVLLGPGDARPALAHSPAPPRSPVRGACGCAGVAI